MNNHNPYTAPESNLEQQAGQVQNSSIFWGRGRLNVASFFGQYTLLAIIYYAIFMGIIFLMLKVSETPNGELSDLTRSPLVLIGNAFFSCVVMWIGVCQTIKRFHDRNLSGWWVLTVFIIVGAVILFIPGKKEPNRFGAWRPTRFWEKVMVVVLILFIAAFMAIGFYIGATGG